MIILGIESSCDETSAAVVEDGKKVLSNEIFSQIPLHQKFGGVVPEIASRSHIEKIDIIVQTALEKSGKSLDDIDAIAVTNGPGLVGALLVGLSYAKGLAYAIKKPLIAVHHIEGHIAANYLEYPDLEPPFICLVVSGGHTHIVNVTDYSTFEIMGKTKDDAAGEAFDKVARAIGLGYPGGAQIDLAAKNGQANIPFPHALINEDSYDFSFSGLKSAVLNYLNKESMAKRDVNINDVAASFQQAVVHVLVEKTIRACLQRGGKKLALAGGVSCNSSLRESLAKKCTDAGIEFFVPRPLYCTDNAAMIAACGYFSYIKGDFASLSLNAYPNIKIGEVV